MSNNHLFYSNQCQHSIRLIESINKSSLGSKMNLHNIDNPQVQIPPFITKVPTLYLGNEKKLMTGQDLFTWVNTQINGNSGSGNTLQNQEITGDNSISAFQQNELGGNYSDSYSFIGGDGNNSALNHSFSFLGSENKIPEFTKSGGDINNMSNNSGSNQKQNAMDKAYEQLISQRNSEVPQPIGQVRM